MCCLIKVYNLSENYGIFLLCHFSSFFFTCVIIYFLITYKSSQNFSRKIAWYSEGIFRWGSHRLSHIYKQLFLFVLQLTKLNMTTG